MDADSVVTVASFFGSNGIVATAIGIGSALGVTGIIGKFLWRGINDVPNHAEQHRILSENMAETKTHVQWIRNHLESK